MRKLDSTPSDHIATDSRCASQRRTVPARAAYLYARWRLLIVRCPHCAVLVHPAPWSSYPRALFRSAAVRRTVQRSAARVPPDLYSSRLRVGSASTIAPLAPTLHLRMPPTLLVVRAGTVFFPDPCVLRVKSPTQTPSARRGTSSSSSLHTAHGILSVFRAQRSAQVTSAHSPLVDTSWGPVPRSARASLPRRELLPVPRRAAPRFVRTAPRPYGAAPRCPPPAHPLTDRTHPAAKRLRLSVSAEMFSRISTPRVLRAPAP
ncbi:hypothetical protein C8R44DRAFT_985011 [Mycena epipterygia]|nr:hypothetical protein C8R44DRAFT_985011 [Mycena epipterygia]